MAYCVVTEYGKFCPLPSTYQPRCLDGYNTQGENIADNGGILQKHLNELCTLSFYLLSYLIRDAFYAYF